MSDVCTGCSWRSESRIEAVRNRVALVALHSVVLRPDPPMTRAALDTSTDGMCERCLRRLIDEVAVVASGLAQRLGMADEWRAALAEDVPSWALTVPQDGIP
jgi:hypothetical protein